MLRALFPLLLGALLSACAPEQQGDRGIGGTGIHRANRGLGGTGVRTADRGIGGTGIAPDSGIGGTGIHNAERGIGGTGIVGTVTAFGSIWVNGVEVDLPPAVTVRIEGRPTAPGAVQIGHTVAITARTGTTQAGSAPTSTATAVDVRYAVAGPVEAVENGTLTVLGQRVDLGGALLAVELRPGTWVAVSGLRRPDGAIAAGRVEPWDAARGWLLRGTAGAGTPGTLVLPGLTARLAASVPAPQPGQPVRAAGWLDTRGALATEAASDPLNPFGTGIGALSVEVFVDAAGRPAGTGPALSAPAAPGRIVIEGVVDRQGELRPGRSASAPGIGRTSAPGIGGPAGVGGPAGAPAGAAPAAGQATGQAQGGQPAASSTASPAASAAPGVGARGPGGPGGGRGGRGGGGGGGGGGGR